MYEQHLAPYDLDSSQERTSRGIDDELVVAIAHFNRWLLQIATDINENNGRCYLLRDIKSPFSESIVHAFGQS